MSFTNKQISNFLNESVLFRVSISDTNLIKFDDDTLFTFDELEKIVKRNFDYWSSIAKATSYTSRWESLYEQIKRLRETFTNLGELEIDNINNHLYYNFSNHRQLSNDGKNVYILSIDSPIDKDSDFRKIRSFVSFYIKHSESNLEDATQNFIQMYKDNSYIGSHLSSRNPYSFYPALYLLRKTFSNIKENVSEFEQNIVNPLSDKLNEIEKDSDKQYREITSFTEEKHEEIQKQFDNKVTELNEFQATLDSWQDEKQERLNILEDTYEKKLSLEAPEKLWNDRATEHQKLARDWTVWLIFSVVLLIFALVLLVVAIHNYSLNIIKEIPFISESFIFISVISFFIYIIRVLIKIVMSNHHLATEYKQKAALTRFYQSLIYAGTDIDKEERLIIINSLFSRVDTGLVRTDNSSDSDAILAMLSKSIK